MALFRRCSYFFALWVLCTASILILSAIGRILLWKFAAGIDFFMAETWEAWCVALRFDLMVAAYFSAPILFCWLCALAFPRRRNVFLRTGTVLTCIFGTIFILIEIINFGFFCEYHDQFNIWVLGAVNDDANAIFRTIAEEYHWGRYLATALAAIGVWIFGMNFLAKRVFRFVARRNRNTKTALVILPMFLIIAVICYRGGVSRRPPRLRDAAVCETDAVNRLVLNPAFALKHAAIDSWKISNGGKQPEFVKDLRQQSALIYGERAGTATTIHDLILKKNERAFPSDPLPRRVYLFVMESYDRWPMREKYAGNDLCDTLRALEKAGASSDNFASAAQGTMLTLTTLMSGIPHIDVAQNYRPNGARALPTATAKIFRALGYKTRFAYCGYGLWQHVEDYARDQGFDEIVLGSDIENCPEKYKGEWGVPDGFLFSHLAELAEKDGDVPVFTLVLSASYHPPYNLPLEKLGCAPADLSGNIEKISDGSVPRNTFSHFKYADRELGKFVARVSSEDPNAIIAVTGDHFSRHFPNKTPTLDERTQVPFVIVGKDIPAGTQLPFGTHADIVPTLLSLCAPEGFVYPSFGENLFSEKARSRECTLGAGVVLHKDGGALYGNAKVHYGERASEETAARREALVDAWRALAWVYFEKGNATEHK